jgi:MerR family copper efflux transcriptional regulator
MNLHIAVFSIGALAKASGVTTPTIRYYEEIGLIPKARRSPSGQRVDCR